MGCVMNWDKQLDRAYFKCQSGIGGMLLPYLTFMSLKWGLSKTTFGLKFHESNFPELDSFHQVSVCFFFSCLLFYCQAEIFVPESGQRDVFDYFKLEIWLPDINRASQLLKLPSQTGRDVLSSETTDRWIPLRNLRIMISPPYICYLVWWGEVSSERKPSHASDLLKPFLWVKLSCHWFSVRPRSLVC